MNGFAVCDPFWLSLGAVIGLPLAAFVSFFASRRLAAGDLFLDRPNERSSHAAATPRAGGVAVFAGWAGAMAVFASVSGPTYAAVTGAPNPFAALAILAATALALGVIDDWAPLPARAKLYGQVGAAVIFVLMFGGLKSVPLPVVGETALGGFGPIVTVFWIVAFMNVFNFMDGLNGIAALCGLLVSCVLAVAAALNGETVWAMTAAALGAALLGFAPVNFPGGRLFLGDGGSLSVSYILACLAVLVANGSGGKVSALFVPVAFAPFVFDVAFTLAHRWRRRQPLMSAHREHLYQLLVRAGRSHAASTSIYLVLTAISCVAALWLLTTPPREHWIAPLLLVLAMAGPAALVYRGAVRADLLPMPEPPAYTPRRRARRQRKIAEKAG